MLTIGIDPGLERIGIGIVKNSNRKLTLVYNRLITTPSKLGIPDRLNIIHEELSCILKDYPVDHASVEKLYFAKNIKTAMMVSEARGVILLALRQKQVPVFEYTPLQVKQAMIGYGRAAKSQIQEFVRVILNLSEIPKPDDVADGIALAIVHINSFRTLSKIERHLKK